MKHILIVDDDVHINQMLEEVLTSAGYKVTHAYSGTEAILLIPSIKPDLILLDLMLPGLSGEEIIEEISHIPVIVISAKIDTKNKILAGFTSGEDFVQKMADIYEYPEVREELANYPTWIRNIITVIDYDTELAMDGLEFKSYRNVIDDLTDIGVTTEAQVLIELESDMSQDGIDSCYSKLALNNDYEAFWDKIYLYADKNMKQ